MNLINKNMDSLKAILFKLESFETMMHMGTILSIIVKPIVDNNILIQNKYTYSWSKRGI
jgi:phage terminase large subunit